MSHNGTKNATAENRPRLSHKLPDIVLIDGGPGHVNAAKEVLDELGVNIPAFGMIKDKKHRTRGLVASGKTIGITDSLPVLRLVTAIQEEAHRFAVEYNKKLREKRYSGSILDNIEGIGPKRKKALIRHFGSISRIRDAGIDDLLSVEGINKPAADKIYDFFRRQ